MSRSYRKVAGYKDCSPWYKNYANRRVRRKSVEFFIPNGNGYRRLTCSYDICDWSWLFYTESSLREYCNKEYPWRDVTPERAYNRLKSK